MTAWLALGSLTGTAPGVIWMLVLAWFAGPVGVGLSLWRRDITARQRAENRADKADQKTRAADERAAVAEDTARQWMAHADDLAARIERHQHACLGELIHQNDGVKP